MWCTFSIYFTYLIYHYYLILKVSWNKLFSCQSWHFLNPSLTYYQRRWSYSVWIFWSLVSICSSLGPLFRLVEMSLLSAHLAHHHPWIRWSQILKENPKRRRWEFWSLYSLNITTGCAYFFNLEHWTLDCGTRSEGRHWEQNEKLVYESGFLCLYLFQTGAGWNLKSKTYNLGHLWKLFSFATLSRMGWGIEHNCLICCWIVLFCCFGIELTKTEVKY